MIRRNLTLLVAMVVLNSIVHAQLSLDEIKTRLEQDNALEAKISAILELRKYNNKEANDLLVSVLDDPSEGGTLRGSILAHAPWLHSLHILSERFPEAGVNPKKYHLGIRYDEAIEDLNKFKSWWHHNRDRIEYANTTHSLTLKAIPNAEQTESASLSSVSEDTRESASISAAAATQQQTPIPPTAAPDQRAQPGIRTVAETKSAPGFPIIPVAIVGAVMVGIVLLYLLRLSEYRRGNKG